MTLDKVSKGQRVTISRINNETARLQAIRCGLGEGSVITCLEIVPAGPIIIGKAKQEIAIGRDLAKTIDVELWGSK